LLGAISHQLQRNPLNAANERMLDTYLAKITEAKSRDGVYAFRGQSNSEWALRSSAVRRLIAGDETQLQDPQFPSRYVGYHKDLMDRAHALGFDIEDGRRTSVLQLFAKLQHFGAATGLLDFSRNPLVALWVACRDHPDRNGSIFVVNTGNLVRFEAAAESDEFTDVNAIFSRADQAVPNLMYWEPVLHGPAMMRILRQRSVFVIGRPFVSDEDVEKSIIEKSDKRAILKALEQVDISQKTLFQDLHGFCSMEGVDAPSQVIATPQVHLRRGNSYFSDGDFRQAIASYEQCIGLHPRVSEPYFLRGNAKAALGLREANAGVTRTLFEDAVKDYDQAIHHKDVPVLGFDEDQVTPTAGNWFLFSIFFNRGNIKFMLDDFDGAVADYGESARLAPEFSEAYFNRGNARFEQHNWTEAIADFNLALERSYRAAAQFNRGNALVLKGDFGEALNAFRSLRTDGNLGPASLENVGKLEQIIALLGGANNDGIALSVPAVEITKQGRVLVATFKFTSYQGQDLIFSFRGGTGNTGNMGGNQQSGGRGFPGRPSFILQITAQ